MVVAKGGKYIMSVEFQFHRMERGLVMVVVAVTHQCKRT